MSWQSTPLRGFRISARRAGRSRESDGGRKQRVELRVARAELDRGFEPLAMGPARRCDGATLPTWLEMIFRRRLWNAPPSGTGTVPAPYQLSSMMVASSPAISSAVASPAAVALA